MSTRWRWRTLSGLPLTLTLDSDDPDQIALVERSAAANFITLERVEEPSGEGSTIPDREEEPDGA